MLVAGKELGEDVTNGGGADRGAAAAEGVPQCGGHPPDDTRAPRSPSPPRLTVASAGHQLHAQVPHGPRSSIPEVV